MGQRPAAQGRGHQTKLKLYSPLRRPILLFTCEGTGAADEIAFSILHALSIDVLMSALSLINETKWARGSPDIISVSPYVTASFSFLPATNRPERGHSGLADALQHIDDQHRPTSINLGIRPHPHHRRGSTDAQSDLIRGRLYRRSVRADGLCRREDPGQCRRSTLSFSP